MEPFAIPFSQSAVDDLRKRLQGTRWPDQVPGTGWEYGTHLMYLKELCSYWEKEFDWERQVSSLNSFKHYKTQIDDCLVHFVHERGKG
ncbi:MAG TPA: epoxide hydrolase N-terminal domain-containing protein, partial [Bacteroidota bacterium]|nr:epoxide hydrolase N-terminal domain-containing protein [Bacteroidota bacterium]